MTNPSYVQRSVMKDYPFFDFDVIEETDKIIKCRPRKNYNILPLIKLLHPLMTEPRRFSDLLENSQLRFKRRFLEYLRLSKERGFVRLETRGKFDYYILTDKGRTLMELFC